MSSLPRSCQRVGKQLRKAPHKAYNKLTACLGKEDSKKQVCSPLAVELNTGVVLASSYPLPFGSLALLQDHIVTTAPELEEVALSQERP